MEILAVVPARGGSKGIPGKNIKPLAGKPLIGYTIDAARESRYLTRVVVSTDDAAIARVARQFGADVPFMRPAELAGDEVTDLPVFQHCLSWLEEQDGYRPEIVVHLRPTAPLRRTEHIDACVEMLLASDDADAVRSVCAAGVHPLKMWSIDGRRLRPFVPEDVYGVAEAYNQPRQRLPRAYVQNGSVDVVRARVIRQDDSMTGQRILAYVMDESESVNLDSPLDWALAETLLCGRRKSDAAIPGKPVAAGPAAR